MVTINFSDCATPVEMIAKYARSINPKSSIKEENVKLLASLVNRKYSLRFSPHTIKGLIEVFRPLSPGGSMDDSGGSPLQMAFPGWQDTAPPTRGTGPDERYTITIPAVEAQATTGAPRYSAEKIMPKGADHGADKSAGKSTGKTSRKEPVEPYATFARMRKVGFSPGARRFPDYYGATAKVFVAQAEFMKDFSDDARSERPFLSYYPTYETMDDEQLRTYFTWRAAVRKGEARDIGLPYLQCYINELLNNIGPTSAADGMDSLIRLWVAYREKYPWLDYHMYRWIRDYYVVHHRSLTRSFTDYRLTFPVAASGMSDDDWDKVLVCPWGELPTLELLSSFRVTRGSFYKKSNQALIERCVCFVMQELADWFATAGVDFKALFYSIATDYNYHPFSDAIVDGGMYQHIRAMSVALDHATTVVHDGAAWHIERLSTHACSRVVGYILKMIEMKMRLYVAFRSELTKPRTIEVENALLFYPYHPGSSNKRKSTAIKQKHWKETALDLLVSAEFEQRIEVALSAFCARNHVVVADGQMTELRPVEIDMSQLGRIRAEHRQTAEMLHAGEDGASYATPKAGERTQAGLRSGASGTFSGVASDISLAASSWTSPEAADGTASEATADAPLAAGPTGFPGLVATLSDRERAFLSSLLTHDPGADRADADLTAESINEKAIATIDDNLVEGFDGHYTVYEEYAYDIRRILEEAIHTT